MESNGRLLIAFVVCVSGIQGFIFGIFDGIDTELVRSACNKSLTTAAISHVTFSARSSILHTVQLPGPKLVHKVGLEIDACPPGKSYELALIDLQYIDATDVTRTKRDYLVGMVGKKNEDRAMMEYVIDTPLYTDALYITTHSSLDCIRIVPLGCAPSDVCSSTHCFNGGTCIGEGICACAKGFFGNSCEKTLADLPIDDYSPKYVQNGTLVTNNGDFTITGDFRLIDTKKRTLFRICQMMNAGASFLLHHTHNNFNGGSSHYSHAYSQSPSSVFGYPHSSGYTQSCHLQFNNNHNHAHKIYFYNTHHNCYPGNAGSSFMYQNNALHMNVNNGNSRYSMQVPWTPSPNYAHQVSSSFSPQYGCSIYVDGKHMGSMNRPEPHSTYTRPGNYCYGSCAYSRTYDHSVPTANYMLGQSQIAGMCTPQLAHNGLLPLCGLSSIQPPVAQPTAPQPTPSSPSLTTQVFSATRGRYSTASSVGGGLTCYSCTHSTKDGDCQTPKQCSAGDVCALFHDPSGYTHSCLPKAVCNQAKSMTASNCWICCDSSLCNRQCGPAVSACDDTSSCAILKSTGYDVCSDQKAAKNECKQSCGYCGSGK